MTVLYQNIKSWCERKNTSISALERNAGVPGNTVLNWKEERRWMVHLSKIANTMGTSIDSLFLSKAEQNAQPAIDKLIGELRTMELDDKAADFLIEFAHMLSDRYANRE